MNPTAAEIAEALRPVIREEVLRAMAKQGRTDVVSLAEARRQLGIGKTGDGDGDNRTLYARLRKAGRTPVRDRTGRVKGVRQADLDAMIAPPL